MAKSKFDEVCDAIALRDCKKIDSIIGESDVNALSSDGWNYLHMALMSVTMAHDPKIVSHLIDLGVDVNARDDMQFTPLHFAVRSDISSNAETVSVLLNAGAAVNVPNDDGFTPMHLCIQSFPRNLEIASMLISAGAELDTSYGAITVRDFATTTNFPDRDAVLELLNNS